MADHYLGDAAVVKGNLLLPRIGAWTAEVWLAGNEAPAVGTQTVLTVAGTDRVATVIASSSDYLQAKCRVVAGAGRLQSEIQAKDYRGYTAPDVVRDILTEAGETPGSWIQVSSIQVQTWQRTRGPCRNALQRFLRLVTGDTVWRVFDDGTVDSVDDVFDVTGTSQTFAELASWGQERLLLLGVQDSVIRPGDAVEAFGQDRRLDRCLYEFDEDNFKLRAWYL